MTTAQGKPRFFNMAFPDRERACDLLWADDDATARGRTLVNDFFVGLTGQVWFETRERGDLFQALLDREGIPYTLSERRAHHSPVVDPFLSVQEGR